MFALRSFCRYVFIVIGLFSMQAEVFGYALMPYRWDKQAVPIFFRFDPGVYNASFYAAMKKWNVISSGVQLQNGSHNLPQSAVGIRCGEGGNSASFSYSVCGKVWGERVLAITLVSEVGGIAMHGDILFNPSVPYALYNGPVRGESRDFGRVALHELGHFLGLNHETSAPSIMRPIVGDFENLFEDDKKGVNARYPN